MRKISYAQAINEAIHEEMIKDETVFLIGEDIGILGNIFGVTKGLLEEFGEERIKETPISEAAIVGCALGSAIMGLRPIVEIMYIDFTAVCMDQIVNQVAKIRYMSGNKLNAPLVIRTQGGGGRGNAAQHSQSLEAWFVHVPGLKVVMPSTPYDVKGLLKTAIRDDNPVMFIENKCLYFTQGEVPDEGYLINFGEADIKKEGKDITIIATSRQVLTSLQAAEDLYKEGISCEIVDPRTIVPLDKETIIKSVKKTGKVIIVNEGCQRCGVTSELAAVIQEEAFEYLDAPIKRIGSLNVPMPFSQPIEYFVIPSKEKIIESVKTLIG